MCEHLHAHHVEVVTQLLVLVIKQVPAGLTQQATENAV
jgi:hypothetical protein